jgi:DNA-binding beta-propeller fold protein YncE
VFLTLALVGGCSRGPTAEPVVEATPATAPTAEPPLPSQTRVHQGLAVEFGLAPVAGRSLPPGGTFAEGDDVVFRFTIKDTATGTPMTGARPAAWLVPKAAVDAADPAALSRKVAALIRGSRGDRPELDLNVFYVLALNEDATITVVDPLFGFGGSKLLGLVQLPGQGADWVTTADGSRVFVSVPSAKKVAVVDTHSWTMKKAIDCGSRPGRVAIHPDGRSLWVADEDGVTVIDAESLESRKQLRLGRGPHDLALTEDGRFACVANTGGNTVSVVDARSFEATGEVETGPGPLSPAFSSAAGAVYVVHEADGTVAAVSPERRAVVSRVATEPGAAVVRFAPSTRLGFVLNPKRNRVSVFDPATSRVVQTGETDPDADQLAFTDRLLYVRQRGTPTVRTAPLDQLGGGGKPVPAATFPGGQKPPAAAGGPCLAAAISAAPGDGAVLVANPADRAIYFYKEGMAAPMGSFNNYGHAPRAVLAVDRSLRSRGPGVYETTARLRRPGEYRVLFFVDSPRLIQAFDLTVKADPSKPAATVESVVVEALPFDAEPTAGKSSRIAFRLVDARTKAPRSGLADVTVLAFSPSGWQKRHSAVPAGEPGTYAFEFTPPAEGVYYLYAEAPSAGLTFNQSRFVVLEVKAGAK